MSANPNREVNKKLSNASNKISNGTKALGDAIAELIEAEDAETNPERKAEIRACRKEFALANAKIVNFGSTILALQANS